MRVYELVYAGPLKGDGPTQLERMLLLVSDLEQLSRYQNLVRGREISLTVLASDDLNDHLPNLISYDMLDAENAKRNEAEQTDQGADDAPMVQ